MPTDRNLELAELVHAMQARTALCSSQLKAKLDAAPNSTHIELRSEGVQSLVWLLDTQSQLLAKLFEENATIQDQLEGLLRSYLKK